MSHATARGCGHKPRLRRRGLFLEQFESRILLASLPAEGLVSWWRAEGDALDSADWLNGLRRQ